jgi:hypothetical protein
MSFPLIASVAIIVDITMGVITILCPRTGKQVSTGIEIGRDQFARMRETRFTMSCWLCGGEHVWSKRWATFLEDVPEDGTIVPPEVARERA